MLVRVVVILVAVGFVASRIALALAIRKARLTGDRRREERLRTRGFGLYRWAAAAVLVFVVVLSLLVWSNSR